MSCTFRALAKPSWLKDAKTCLIPFCMMVGVLPSENRLGAFAGLFRLFSLQMEQGECLACYDVNASVRQRIWWS